MANSIIDDMLKNQVPNQGKKKGSKFLLVLVLLLVIAIIGGLVYILVMKTRNKMTPKDAFITYLGKGNVSTVFNLEKLDKLNYRTQSESSTSTTEITGNLSSAMLDADFDLSELKVKVESKNNPNDGKNSSDVVVTYKDNEILSWSTLGNSEDIGIIINDVIIKYIGSSYSNLGDILNRLSGDNSFSGTLDLAMLKDTKITLPQLSNEMFLKYIDIINQKVPDTAFTSKSITLNRASGNVDVTEYTMSIKESQALEIIDLALQNLENDDVLLDMLLSAFPGATGQEKEIIKAGIELYINSMYETAPDDSRVYTIKVYGANDLTYRVSLNFYGESSIDIDYDYTENNNGITITYLEAETQSGYSIDIAKSVSDVSEKLKLAFNLIQESEIVGKISFTSDLVNSGNSYTLKDSIGLNYSSIINVTLQTNSQISFREVEIEDLTGDNCIYLDELDKDTFDDIMSAVEARTAEVINENLISQGENAIIDMPERPTKPTEEDVQNNPPEGDTQDTPPVETIDVEDLKENAKNKIITYVSEAMAVAQSEEREYTLNDLLELEIPDSTFSVSIEDGVAILNIDGFEFKLNSEFQLYE